VSENNRVNLFQKQVHFITAHLIFWPIFFIGIAADLISKSVIFNWLSTRQDQSFNIISGFFQLVMVENKGAAWGIAHNKTLMLISFSVIAIFIVFGVFLFSRKMQLIVVIALGLFAAGIFGNLYDRLYNHGSVRDFLDFHLFDKHFPAFNIAYSMLTIAVTLLVLTTLLAPKEKEPSIQN